LKNFLTGSHRVGNLIEFAKGFMVASTSNKLPNKFIERRCSL